MGNLRLSPIQSSVLTHLEEHGMSDLPTERISPLMNALSTAHMSTSKELFLSDFFQCLMSLYGMGLVDFYIDKNQFGLRIVHIDKDVSKYVNVFTNTKWDDVKGYWVWNSESGSEYSKYPVYIVLTQKGKDAIVS